MYPEHMYPARFATFIYKDVVNIGNGSLRIKEYDGNVDVDWYDEIHEKWSPLGINDFEYCMGLALLHFEAEEMCAWTMADFRRVAQVIYYENSCINYPSDKYEQICGIKKQHGTQPDPWDVVKARLKAKSHPFYETAEGAD